MLNSIRDFFDRHIGAAPVVDETQSIQLATAALLVEVARIDSDFTERERAVVQRIVRERFGISGPEAIALIDLAEAEVSHAHDYFQFTSLVNRHFNAEQKLRVIELMWRVAYADEELSAHENHLMRRIADLLHVPHGDYIAAKMRAREPER